METIEFVPEHIVVGTYRHDRWVTRVPLLGTVFVERPLRAEGGRWQLNWVVQQRRWDLRATEAEGAKEEALKLLWGLYRQAADDMEGVLAGWTTRCSIGG